MKTVYFDKIEFSMLLLAPQSNTSLIFPVKEESLFQDVKIKNLITGYKKLEMSLYFRALG